MAATVTKWQIQEGRHREADDPGADQELNTWGLVQKSPEVPVGDEEVSWGNFQGSRRMRSADRS